MRKYTNHIVIFSIVFSLILGCATPVKTSLSFPIFSFSKYQDWTIASLALTYPYQQIQIAHVWEHLILRHLRILYPQYLYTAQTRPNCIIIECTYPIQDNLALSRLLEEILFFKILQKDLQEEIQVLKAEKSLFSSTNIPEFSSFNSEEIFDKIRQFQQTLLFKSNPRLFISTKSFIPKNKRILEKNHSVEIIQADIPISETDKVLGQILSVHLSQILFKEFVNSGGTYQANTWYKKNKLGIQISIPKYSSYINYQKKIYQLLENCQKNELSHTQWAILWQRTWLYCCTNNISFPNWNDCSISKEMFAEYCKKYYNPQNWDFK